VRYLRKCVQRGDFKCAERRYRGHERIALATHITNRSFNMRTFNTWNLTLCSAFFFTLSFGATGCDEEQGELADVRLVHGTHVAASRAASDSAPAAVERKAPLEPSKSPTKPWEPGNGYFDLVDSETYYDSCPPDNAAPGFEYV